MLLTATGATKARPLKDIAAEVLGNVWQHPRGAAEMAGDGDYLAAKVIGAYDQIAAGGAFNQIQLHVWCATTGADIEWKVWVRDSAAAFNMQGVAADDSGSIRATDFPHANTLYTLSLTRALTAIASQYVFIMFRAASDVAMATRKWAWNAAVPARHGFPLQAGAGWNQNVLFSDYHTPPGGDYGQVAFKLLRTVAPVTSAYTPRVVLPPNVYGVQAREGSIYFDNLLPDVAAADYVFDVTTGVLGTHQNERWTWTPSGAQAGTTLTLSVYSRATGALLTSASTTISAVAAPAGAGLTPKVILVGDSLTNAGTIGQTLLDIAAADTLKIALYGIRGTPPNSHEGRPGWTIVNYTSNFSDGTGANPFWKSGAVNFPQYLTDNVIPVPDWVFVLLGTNDVFSQTTDVGVSSAAAASFTSLDTLIASIKAAGAGVKVGLVTPPPPASDQDAFGASYGVAQARWRYKRNVTLWNRELIARYSGQTASRIYLVPVYQAIDAAHNFPVAVAAPWNSRTATTVARQSNGVHPDTSGYQQIADAEWAFLKAQV